jgi:hypothetical protein
MRVLPSQNVGFGFLGSVETFLETWATPDSAKPEQIWEAVFKMVATALKLDAEKTRFLLDSKLGRWMFDDMTGTLPAVGDDESKKTKFTVKHFTDAAKRVYTQKWFLKEVPTQLAAMDESIDDGSASRASLAEDLGDKAFYGNIGDFVRREAGKTGFLSDEVSTNVEAKIEAVFRSPKFFEHYRKAVFAAIRADKALVAAIKRDGFKLTEGYDMDDITKAVFETTEDGELPFHGELVVEGDDGQSVTLDEADVMEDVVIEAFENAIADAVMSNPNEHATALREIDELLAEGDYETAMERGVYVLRKCGVDEALLDEFKKGFKTSATQRARMGRARMKAKTGTQLMALRARRRAARKGSSRMKRARYYKQNKRRISRRRAQLQNSFELDATLVAEMAEQGMTFVVLQDGEEPVFATTRQVAESLAGDGAVVIELSAEQIEEAKSKGKPFMKKAADDEDEADGSDEEETDESIDEKKNCDDEDEESDDEEDDYEDGEEDDEEETDESIDESAASKLANEIAKFMKAHPRVGYGELATRFKIGRDVAQQAVIIAGRVAGAKGDKGSWLHLATEIMGKLLNHSAGEAPDMPAKASMPQRNLRVGQVASVQDDGANLAEDGDESESVDEAGLQGTNPKVRITAGNKAGVTKVSKQALPKAKLKGKEGAIKSAHGRGESIEDEGIAVLEWFKDSPAPKQKQKELYDIWNVLGLNLDTTDAEDQDDIQDVRAAVQAAAVALETGKRAEMSVVRDLKKALMLSDYLVHADFKSTIRSTLASLNRPAKRESAEDEVDAQMVEVTAPLTKTEALVAAAAQNGLASTTKVRVQTKEGLVSMLVPAAVADSIRKAIA